MPDWLVGVDVDRIQEYVFESSRLPEIGGASGLLQDIEDSLKKDFQGRGYKVVVGGGSMLIWVQGEKSVAEEVARAVESEYISRTLVCTATAAIVEWDGRDLQDARARLAYELRRAKDEKKTWPWFESLPYALRCESCNKRPAHYHHRDTRVPGESRWLCLACERKYKYEGVREDIKEAKELRHIAEHCGRGKLGVIHLDGDGIGDKLGQIESWGDLKQFSQALASALSAAVDGTLSKLGQPYRRLFVGGDDLYLFVPGEWALDVALQIEEQFRRKWEGTPEGKWGPVTVSGAVLIADEHTPVYFLHRLLIDFERYAKQWKNRLAVSANATVGQGQGEGWLCFRVMLSSGSSTGSAREFFDSLLEEPQGMGSPVWEKRTLRPCPAGEVRQLLEWTRTLKTGGVPQGTILRLRDAMWRSRFEGAVELAYELARTSKKEAREVLAELAGVTAGSQWSHGWRPAAGLNAEGGAQVLETPIGDLAEIWDFSSRVDDAPAAQAAAASSRTA